jgi:hypothetical protein
MDPTVLLGIKPEWPETGYGWIEPAPAVRDTSAFMQIIDNRAGDKLCASREVRLRSQESDYPRPVDRTARRALTVYGGALQSSLAIALRLSRGRFGRSVVVVGHGGGG